MSALTLLLVVGLCLPEGAERVCSYMDVTQRMQVASDQDCYAVAIEANRHNIEIGETPRYACVEPAKYRALMGEKPDTPPFEATEPRRAL